jgi:alpha-amylase/alpha-mannosidase (GH57 family)
MNRYICIHGHFYQPPRENPWLEAIELQDATYPYHDWNERITAECYATNATSRILDEQGRIAKIVNNYAKISFNFGPTLLAWLEEKAPDVYETVLSADKESVKRFSGHGSAIAQVYNHLIMPLASSRDKRTQVLWGIEDFEYRFGRKPEGMWLPETAVDLETLEIVAEHEIRFTILAPHQAGRVRGVDGAEWNEVSGDSIDPKRPYLCRLPSGRTIALFFYDGPISHDISFGELLKSGEALAKRLIGTFAGQSDTPQLVHVACDGETFGHHHRFGEMALSYALHYIESNNLAVVTNYGEYLEKFPPRHEVEIAENTSWSCVHGVERWRSNCGCNTGGHPQWHQTWRTPLREALDWLRDTLAAPYEKHASRLVKDPWAARDEYIRVVLKRSRENVKTFLRQHSLHPLSQPEEIALLKLLELQRHAMLMYTSCGWFFDELSGIETIQILQYAGRALQVAQELFRNVTESTFLHRLEEARSNISDLQNGRVIYEKYVKPAMVGLEEVAAHFAISSLFNGYEQEASLFCYSVRQEEYKSSDAGKARLVAGRATFVSDITRESETICFGVLYMGDHSLNCGVREFKGTRLYQALVAEVFEAFRQADFPVILRLMDKHFGTSAYSLRSLFRDERRKILTQILGSALQEADTAYRQLYEYHAPMMRFLKDLGIPPPKALYSAAEVVLNNSLHRAFESEEINPKLIENLFDEVKSEGISLNTEGLEYTLRRNIERIGERCIDDPADLEALERWKTAIDILPLLPFRVNLWKVQNIYYDLLTTVYPIIRERNTQADNERWISIFTSLGEALRVRVDS